MSLLDVKHQAGAQEALQRALMGDRLPHALIFHGPDGVGKELLAMGLAGRLLCEHPIEETLEGDQAEAVGLTRLQTGCGKCEDCRAVGARTHPDLFVIHRHQNREHPDPTIRNRKGLNLGIEVIRHFLINNTALTPVRGRGKVFVVRQADRITPAAQNAMLKTLEEPPSGVCIILLVGSMDRLLPTTLSRCQAVRFDALPTAFVADKLREKAPDLPADRAGWYARIGNGSVGKALEHVEEELYEENGKLVDCLSRFHVDKRAVTPENLLEQGKSLSGAYRKHDPEISDTEATRRALKSLLALMACWYGDLLRFAGGESAALTNAAFTKQIKHASAHLTPERAAQAIGRIAGCERQLDLNVNTQLCLDSLVIDLANLSAARSTTARPA